MKKQANSSPCFGLNHVVDMYSGQRYSAGRTEWYEKTSHLCEGLNNLLVLWRGGNQLSIVGALRCLLYSAC